MVYILCIYNFKGKYTRGQSEAEKKAESEFFFKAFFIFKFIPLSLKPHYPSTLKTNQKV